MKAEYLYVHLPASSLNLTGLQFGNNPGATNTTLRFNNNLNIVRLGANFRF